MNHKQHAVVLALILAASCSAPPDKYHAVQTKVFTEDALADRDDALANEEEIRNNNESLREINDELRRRSHGSSAHSETSTSTLRSH